MRVIVCGGGVIGSSAAYFLSRRGAEVTLVERTGVANASSGKAGAFLALDWSRGSALDGLSRRSFALHAQLADELGNTWGYQRVTTYGAYAAPGLARRRGNVPGRDWLADDVAVTGGVGSPGTTAVGYPRFFTQAVGGGGPTHRGELRGGEGTGVAPAEGGATGRGGGGGPPG